LLKNISYGKGYGLLPEPEVHSVPFEEYAMDLIGLWTVQVCGKPYEFKALTTMDTATNLVKLIRIDDKELKTVAKTNCTMLANTLSVASALHS
jgi:hypothetical protein